MPFTSKDTSELARRLIREHGERAVEVAAREGDACTSAGDMEGAYTWRRVIALIRDITGSSTDRAQ